MSGKIGVTRNRDNHFMGDFDVSEIEAFQALSMRDTEDFVNGLTNHRGGYTIGPAQNRPPDLPRCSHCGQKIPEKAEVK